MAFRKQYRGLEDTEIFSRETELEMFDIVNREYEENGSFRCDFFATKERDRDTGCIAFGRVLPLRKTQNS